MGRRALHQRSQDQLDQPELLAAPGLLVLLGRPGLALRVLLGRLAQPDLLEAVVRPDTRAAREVQVVPAALDLREVQVPREALGVLDRQA